MYVHYNNRLLQIIDAIADPRMSLYIYIYIYKKQYGTTERLFCLINKLKFNASQASEKVFVYQPRDFKA